MTHEQSWRSSLPGEEPGAPMPKPIAGVCQVHRRRALRENWGPLGFSPRNKLLCVEVEQGSFITYSFMNLYVLKRSSSQGAGPHLSLERSSISPDPVAGTTENAAKPQNPIQEGRRTVRFL